MNTKRSSSLPPVDTETSPIGQKRSREATPAAGQEATNPTASPATQYSVPTPGRPDFDFDDSTSPTMSGTGAPNRQLTTRQGGPEATKDAQPDQLEMTDPRERIDEFNWLDLQQRYHDMIKECSDAEEELWKEFNGLIDYFTVWANTTHQHEVERSFKRLKTRIHHVQSSEDQLEQKRQHYIRVVQAFESALNLLNGP